MLFSEFPMATGMFSFFMEGKGYLMPAGLLLPLACEIALITNSCLWMNFRHIIEGTEMAVRVWQSSFCEQFPQQK